MIIDESAIKSAELLSRIEELQEDIEELKKALSKKQAIIDQWQIEDYFEKNYPRGSQ
tara:strand:+ start:423 stop:593 length:171 start_codon:yes stop_codon:yes gene_type:complete